MPPFFRNPSLLFLCLVSLDACTARAEIKPNGLFCDNAILQQGMTVPVWGTADPGDVVTVEFAGQKKTDTADANGRWLVNLDPMKASAEPGEMLVSATNPKSEIPRGTLSHGTHVQNLKIRNLLVGEVWLCSGQSNMAWPLSKTTDAQAAIAASTDPLLRLWSSSNTPADEPPRDAQGQWRECSPESVASFSAVAYYCGRDLRKALNVPIGLVHAAVNGTSAEAWISRPVLTSEPRVKSAIDRFEKRVQEYTIAMRQHPEMLAKHKEAVEKAKQEGKEPPTEPRAPIDPRKHRDRLSGCYNGLIAPLIPYAMRGVLWYQGEANVPHAFDYRTLMPMLIRSWRHAWGIGEFPFLMVQIAPCGAIYPDPLPSAWAELREAQLLTSRSEPKTGLVVITDCGAEADIHPPHKEPVGVRLAMAARGIAYGEKIVWSGPTFDSIQVQGDKAILTFHNVGSGLVAKDGGLKGFTIAGEDQKFVNADARIEGDKIVVSSPKIANPVAVRFGWANYPVVNLYNKEGLPASPFRTDDFPLTTAPK